MDGDQGTGASDNTPQPTMNLAGVAKKFDIAGRLSGSNQGGDSPDTQDKGDSFRNPPADDANKDAGNDNDNGSGAKPESDNKDKPSAFKRAITGDTGTNASGSDDKASGGDDSASTIDSIATPDNMSTDSMKGWDALKSKAKDFEAKSQQLEKELESYRSNQGNVDPKIVEEHKQMSERLRQIDLESHPDFVRSFTEPMRKHSEKIDTVLKESGFDDITASSLLALDRKEMQDRVQDIADSLGVFDKQDFLSSITSVMELRANKDEALKNAEQFKQQTGELHKRQMKDVFNQTFDKFVGGIESDFYEEIKIPDGSSEQDRKAFEEYNESVKNIRARSEAYASGTISPEGIAEVSTKAAHFEHFVSHVMPRFESALDNVIAERDALAREIAQLKGTKPPAPGTRRGDSGSDQGNKPITDIRQAAKAAAERLRKASA